VNFVNPKSDNVEMKSGNAIKLANLQYDEI